MGAGLLKKGCWGPPSPSPQLRGSQGGKDPPHKKSTTLLYKEPADPSEQGQSSSLLISSGLEGGSKNQAPRDRGARLAVWVPHPQPLSTLFAIQQSLPQLLIGDHVSYKGGLLVACPGSGTAGSLCTKKKKKKKPFLYIIPLLDGFVPDSFPVLLQLPSRAQPISFLGGQGSRLP